VIEKLDQVIANSIQPLANRFHWKVIDSEVSDRIASRDYIAGNLFIRVLNHLGLLAMELGSAHNKGQLRSVSLFKDLLEPPWQGHWNLSIQQQCEFVEKHWEWLQNNLDRKHASQTIQRIDNLPL
jgi:hypothetical protein